MSRTTPTAVIENLGRNYDGKKTLTRYITNANVMVNNLVAAASRNGQHVRDMLTDETLEAIECCLACHFYLRHDPQYSSKSTGRASGSFHGQATTRLSGTMYGQDALSLDPTGCLAAMDNGGKVKFMWLGKPVSSQIPYEERD